MHSMKITRKIEQIMYVFVIVSTNQQTCCAVWSALVLVLMSSKESEIEVHIV